MIGEGNVKGFSSQYNRCCILSSQSTPPRSYLVGKITGNQRYRHTNKLTAEEVRMEEEGTSSRPRLQKPLPGRGISTPNADSAPEISDASTATTRLRESPVPTAAMRTEEPTWYNSRGFRPPHLKTFTTEAQASTPRAAQNSNPTPQNIFNTSLMTTVPRKHTLPHPPDALTRQIISTANVPTTQLTPSSAPVPALPANVFTFGGTPDMQLTPPILPQPDNRLVVVPPCNVEVLWDMVLAITQQKLKLHKLPLLDPTKYSGQSQTATEIIQLITEELQGFIKNLEREEGGWLRDKFGWLPEALKALDHYIIAIDVAIQHNAHITALVWAGARTMLKVCPSRNGSHQMESIS